MKALQSRRSAPTRDKGRHITSRVVLTHKIGIELKDLFVDIFIRSKSLWSAAISSLLLPLLAAAFISNMQLGVALLCHNPEIQPWIQGLDVGTLFPFWFEAKPARADVLTATPSERAAGAVETAVGLPRKSQYSMVLKYLPVLFGVFLLVVPFLAFLLLVWLVVRKFNPKHLRLTGLIQRNYLDHVNGQSRNLRSISRLIRKIHYECGGSTIASSERDSRGLIDFFRQFCHANQPSPAPVGRGGDPLGYFRQMGSRRLLSSIVQRFESDAPSTVLGVIDGDMRIQAHSQNNQKGQRYRNFFLLLYFAKLDCYRSPQNQTTRIFSYHAPAAGLPEDQVQYFILNVLCGVSTVVHVELCEECRPGAVCAACQRDASSPMFGLDYVVMPRCRAMLDALGARGRSRMTDNESRATVYVDFDPRAFVLQDGVLVDVFKQDFEKRLLKKRKPGGTDVARVTRLSPEKLRHPDREETLKYYVDADRVARAVLAMIDFFDCAQRLDDSDARTGDIRKAWRKVWEVSAHSGVAQEEPVALRQLASDMISRLRMFKAFLGAPADV